MIWIDILSLNTGVTEESNIWKENQEKAYLINMKKKSEHY